MPLLILLGTEEELRRRQGYPVVTVAQAAIELEVSDSKFRQLVRAGEIKPVAKLAKADLFLIDRVRELKARAAELGLPMPIPKDA